MQTRTKNIAKRVQTKKASSIIFAKNFKPKYFTIVSQPKRQKKVKNKRKKEVITQFIMFEGKLIKQVQQKYSWIGARFQEI